MSGRIPEAVIADVRDRTDIVDVISHHVELKRSGVNHVGLCPFHDEKTPSFNVNGARQFFHCFGCGASGDVIGFLMRLDGRTFIEVVEDLAQRAGIELQREERTARQIAEDARQRSERQQGLELNERVAKLYQRLLEGERAREAREYLRGRGIGEEVIETFRLGFAPPSGDVVARRLAEHDVDMEMATRLGLVARRRQGPGYHDRFWNRVIFPLMGISGEILGFGGRMLGEGDGPKYVNTPETALYHKGQVLYGLAQASASIRKRGEAFVVEGNFDVLQLHQAGMSNTVAPMGTALTPHQAHLLRRFGERAVAIFDGDKAGRVAATRSVTIWLDAEMDGRIATLPQGEDPDSLLAARGAEALAAVIDAAIPGIDYAIAEERENMEDSVVGRAQVVERVAALVRRLKSSVARELYVDRLTLELGVGRGIVARAVSGRSVSGRGAASVSRREAGGRPEASRVGASPPKQAVRVDLAELDLIKILLEHERLFPRAERANLPRLLTSEALRATYATAAAMQAESGRVEISSLLEVADPSVRDAVAQAGLSRDFVGGDPNRALDEWGVTAVARRLKRLAWRIKTHIERAEQAGGETRSLVQALITSKGLTQRFDRAKRSRQLDEVWALVPELIDVEQDIDETQ